MVQLLQSTTRLLECPWLQQQHKGSVEACVRTLAMVGEYPGLPQGTRRERQPHSSRLSGGLSFLVSVHRASPALVSFRCVFASGPGGRVCVSWFPMCLGHWTEHPTGTQAAPALPHSGLLASFLPCVWWLEPGPATRTSLPSLAAKSRAILLPLDLDAHMSALLSSGGSCAAAAQRSAANYKTATRTFPRAIPTANQWDYKNIIEKLQVGWAWLPGL